MRLLRFAGTIVPDLAVEPPIVQVSTRHLGERFEELTTLKSLTNLKLGRIHADAVGEGLGVESRGERQFLVKQKVCRTGPQTNFIRFSTEIVGRPTTIVLPVSYSGIEP